MYSFYFKKISVNYKAQQVILTIGDENDPSYEMKIYMDAYDAKIAGEWLEAREEEDL